ncbi:MAG: hypothetical protein Q8927_00485 [Bacteroidota bacterium]|nr:hypothetical protein [Bacteroidota bacterium]MDP4214642.1 hypothetical protein [Bacteroidota bacterium]MDP4244701.1 hypothetical protein [Bacteroidota bacterium]MDP4253454.1 hypothetical protein [Bacteroidota bacterium]MDP4258948.1 hypothetical protein [Bacteroidota bacterium]
MELEELKQLWRTIEVRPAPSEERERINALLGRRSGSLVTRMRRNLLGELILVISTYVPAILYYVFAFGGRLAEIAWPLSLLLILFAGYYYRKDRLLRGMSCPGCRMRANLERQIGSLQKYVRFYTVMGTIMVPVMAVFSLCLIYYHAPLAPGWKTLGAWAIVLALLTAGSYYLNTRHVRKAYGRHIRKMEELLREMDDVGEGRIS